MFRGTPAIDGKADYSMLLVQPLRQSISLNCWHAEKWCTVKETPWKAGSFLPAGVNRLRIEVAGQHFRVSLNKKLVCEFDDDTVEGPGSLGFCIASVTSAPGAAYFDNLRVRKPAASAAPESKPQPPAVVAATPAPGPVWLGLDLDDAFSPETDAPGPILRWAPGSSASGQASLPTSRA